MHTGLEATVEMQAYTYIGDVVSKAHNGAKISFDDAEYFQLQHEWWHADVLIHLKILRN